MVILTERTPDPGKASGPAGLHLDYPWASSWNVSKTLQMQDFSPHLGTDELEFSFQQDPQDCTLKSTH